MKKIVRVLPIMALVLTPFIIFQWRLKLCWFALEEGIEWLQYSFLISIFYLLAYYLINKNKKSGYVLMWLIYLLLLSLEVRTYGFQYLANSVDLWINILLTITMKGREQL